MTEPTLASYLDGVPELFVTVYRQIESGIPGDAGNDAVEQLKRKLKAFDAAAISRDTKIGSTIYTEMGLKHLGEMLADRIKSQREVVSRVATASEAEMLEYRNIASKVDSGMKYLEIPSWESSHQLSPLEQRKSLGPCVGSARPSLATRSGGSAPWPRMPSPEK